MQLGPNSTQVQAGLPVILVCCGAHLAWSFCCPALPALQRCFSTLQGFQSCWPKRREQGGRARCKNRHADALAGSHRFLCPEESDHLPPSSSWGAGFSWGELPLVGFNIWGFCLCLPRVTSLHGRERVGSGNRCCRVFFVLFFLTLVHLSVIANVRFSSGSSTTDPS